MGEDDGVAVVVEDVDHGVRLHKSSDLPQNKAPLQLVFRLVGGRVFVWKKIPSVPDKAIFHLHWEQIFYEK